MAQRAVIATWAPTHVMAPGCPAQLSPARMVLTSQLYHYITAPVSAGSTSSERRVNMNYCRPPCLRLYNSARLILTLQRSHNPQGESTRVPAWLVPPCAPEKADYLQVPQSRLLPPYQLMPSNPLCLSGCCSNGAVACFSPETSSWMCPQWSLN